MGQDIRRKHSLFVCVVWSRLGQITEDELLQLLGELFVVIAKVEKRWSLTFKEKCTSVVSSCAYDEMISSEQVPWSAFCALTAAKPAKQLLGEKNKKLWVQNLRGRDFQRPQDFPCF